MFSVKFIWNVNACKTIQKIPLYEYGTYRAVCLQAFLSSSSHLVLLRKPRSGDYNTVLQLFIVKMSRKSILNWCVRVALFTRLILTASLTSLLDTISAIKTSSPFRTQFPLPQEDHDFLLSYIVW